MLLLDIFSQKHFLRSSEFSDIKYLWSNDLLRNVPNKEALLTQYLSNVFHFYAWKHALCLYGSFTLHIKLRKFLILARVSEDCLNSITCSSVFLVFTRYFVEKKEKMSHSLLEKRFWLYRSWVFLRGLRVDQELRPLRS